MQGPDHGFELTHLATAAAAGGVARLGGEVGHGVVTPVVDKAVLDQVAGVDEVVHRHQLDGGDA